MLTLALILVPAVAAALILLLGAKASRTVAFGAAWIEIALAATAFFLLRSGTTEWLAFSQDWVPALGLRFSFALDGISLVLVLLSAICTPLILAVAGARPPANPHIFLALILLMISAMLGAFTATDGLVFYLFYEAALLPITFICLSHGRGADKVRTTVKFVLYTLFGSLFMLASLLYVYQHTSGSFALADLYDAGRSLSASEQGWVFAGLFLAFAVKMPVFPFHTWQPATYRMAPTAGTMLLAALMLKMATYGLVRLALPMVPDGISEYGQWALVLSVAGIVYASVMALAQKHYKLLIAYSSIAHVGLISAGILGGSDLGVSGAVFEMFSHGILAVGLFYLCDILEHRGFGDELHSLGGIREANPTLAFLFFAIVMGSVALPFTSGFVGEYLLLQGLATHSIWLAAIAGLTVILGAVYMLRAFQVMMLGSARPHTATFAALNRRELTVLVTVVVLVVALGIYPAPLLEAIQLSIDPLFGTFH